MIILCSNNQSLIILEVQSGDSGTYDCVASSDDGLSLHHSTRLTSFPPPVFAHPPIWNQEPGDLAVTRGETAVLQW